MRDDYLAVALRQIQEAPQYKDGPEYLPDFIQLAIAQQLRRIADGMNAPLVAAAIAELERIPEYAYTGHTPACQGEPGCWLCRALATLRGIGS